MMQIKLNFLLALLGLGLTVGCSDNLGANPDLGLDKSGSSTDSPSLAPPNIPPAPGPAPIPKPVSCTRDPDGVRCQISPGGASTEALIPQFANSNGWLPPEYSSTIRYAYMDGNGTLDVCGRSTVGMQCYLWLGGTFVGPLATDLLTNTNGWTQERYYSTIGLADVSGDGKADLCARTANGIVCFLSVGTNFGPVVTGPAFSDALGYDVPSFYQTIRYEDKNSDGKSDICARDLDGLNYCWISNGTSFAKSGPY